MAVVPLLLEQGREVSCLFKVLVEVSCLFEVLVEVSCLFKVSVLSI